MFARRFLSTWVGIIALSGMFLMGQDAWVPPEPPEPPDPTACATQMFLSDSSLEAAVREEIGVPDGPICLEDLLGHNRLTANGDAIWYLDGLQLWSWLNILYLNNNSISSISPLAGMTVMRLLELGNNQIQDISVLSGMTGMERLILSGNQISDISALFGLSGIMRLYLGNNLISDISALSGLGTSLGYLYLSNNQVSSVSALSGLTGLIQLDLGYNQISDISPLAGLNKLDRLLLNGNQIQNIAVLVSLAGMQLDYVDVTGNPLNATSCDVYVPQLEAIPITVLHDCP